MSKKIQVGLKVHKALSIYRILRGTKIYEAAEALIMRGMLVELDRQNIKQFCAECEEAGKSPADVLELLLKNETAVTRAIEECDEQIGSSLGIKAIRG
jgi:hypothetical protein